MYGYNLFEHLLTCVYTHQLICTGKNRAPVRSSEERGLFLRRKEKGEEEKERRKRKKEGKKKKHYSTTSLTRFYSDNHSCTKTN